MGYIQLDKALFSNPKYASISPEALLAYGLMQDRLSLSKANGERWKNKDDEVFIYFTQKELMSLLGCGHDKITKIMRDLEKAGLIKRIRQGLGKPYQVVVFPVVQGADFPKYKGRQYSDQDCDFEDAINPNKNNLIIDKPDSFLYRGEVEERIKQNISYDVLEKELDSELLDIVVSVIVDAVCGRGKDIRIAGERIERERVVNRFAKLDDVHVRYIFDCIKREEYPIFSLRGYLLKKLFEAEESMDIYYQSLVNYDEKKRRERE